jgi:hypothetical protein
LSSLATYKFNTDERDWDRQLGNIQWSINNTINTTTKKCPSELLFGMKFNSNFENMLGSDLSNQDYPMVQDFDQVRQEASDNIKIAQQTQKQKYDNNKQPAHIFKEGDLVKVTKTNFYNDGKSKKLLPKFIGPFKVVKCLGNDRYNITHVPGFNKSRKYDSVVSADRMRPWIHFKALEIAAEISEDENSESTISSEN